MASCSRKLRASIELFVSDERERRLVEPRLAQLLGLEQRAARDAADLFSGWRLFFERMADQSPVVLAFEDLQWADGGLLDFIDYLLEWSADRPIFVLALGRPELEARRPGWGTSLRLAAARARRDDGTARRARARACPPMSRPGSWNGRRGSRSTRSRRCGCCSTAACSPRRAAGTWSRARSTDLEVPETLQALVAARLDNLDRPSGHWCRTPRC